MRNGWLAVGWLSVLGSVVLLSVVVVSAASDSPATTRPQPSFAASVSALVAPTPPLLTAGEAGEQTVMGRVLYVDARQGQLTVRTADASPRELVLADAVELVAVDGHATTLDALAIDGDVRATGVAEQSGIFSVRRLVLYPPEWSLVPRLHVLAPSAQADTWAVTGAGWTGGARISLSLVTPDQQVDLGTVQADETGQIALETPVGRRLRDLLCGYPGELHLYGTTPDGHEQASISIR